MYECRKQWVATFGELQRELRLRIVMTIRTPKERDEKLNYPHSKPLKRDLLKHPGDWPWSRRAGEILFLERRFGLGVGQNSVMVSTEGRIHPDKNRRHVCAPRAKL